MAATPDRWLSEHLISFDLILFRPSDHRLGLQLEHVFHNLQAIVAQVTHKIWDSKDYTEILYMYVSILMPHVDAPANITV